MAKWWDRNEAQLPKRNKNKREWVEEIAPRTPLLLNPLLEMKTHIYVAMNSVRSKTTSRPFIRKGRSYRGELSW